MSVSSTAPRGLDRLKMGVKRSLAATLHATGLLRLRTRTALRGAAVVLTYHRVLGQAAFDRTWSHPAIAVRTETFEQHMTALRRHYHVLGIDEFAGHVEAGTPFPERACLVTFDDGWIDTFTEAYPILKRHGIPAVVFLPADYVGTRLPFWQERLAQQLHTIWARSREDGQFTGTARAALAAVGCESLLDLSPDAARLGAMTLVQSRKHDDPLGGVRTIDALARETGIAPAADGGVDTYMSWDHVREMIANDISFGGHGLTHRQLPLLPLDDMTAEVEASVNRLRTETGRDVISFSYPNGAWNAATVDAVRASGARVAFTTRRAPVRPDTNRYGLTRINMHEDMTATVSTFLARLAGVL